MIDRLASTFVLAIMALLSLVLWVGAPAFGIWLGGMVATTFGPQLVAALIASLTGLLVVALILGWLNELYLRITGGPVVVVEGITLQRRGPMETLLVGSLVPIAIAIVVWLLLGRPGPP